MAKESFLEVFYVIEHRNGNYLCICTYIYIIYIIYRCYERKFFARIYIHIYLNVELEVQLMSVS